VLFTCGAFGFSCDLVQNVDALLDLCFLLLRGDVVVEIVLVSVAT